MVSCGNETIPSHMPYTDGCEKCVQVEPLVNVLDSLDPDPLLLLSGLRASQTKARADMKPLSVQANRFKLLPILRMTDKEVQDYMDKQATRCVECPLSNSRCHEWTVCLLSTSFLSYPTGPHALQPRKVRARLQLEPSVFWTRGHGVGTVHGILSLRVPH